MKHIAPIALWLLMVVTGSPDCSAEVSTNALVYEVKLDKEVYALGEPISVAFVWSNRTAEVIHIQDWVGPRPQVHGLGGRVRDFVVLFEGKEEVKYRGPSVDMLRTYYWPIQPGKTVSMTNDLSFGYDLKRAGTYVLRSAYKSCKIPGWESVLGAQAYVWEGLSVSPDAQFTIRRLSDTELQPFRTTAGQGDIAAMSVLGAHKDAGAVFCLAEALHTDDLRKCEAAAEALVMIATPSAVNVLGHGALKHPEALMRMRLARLLGETKCEFAIFWLKELLKDNYFEEATVWRPGYASSKRIKKYIVRGQARESLKKLGVADSTPDEEEIRVK